MEAVADLDLAVCGSQGLWCYAKAVGKYPGSNSQKGGALGAQPPLPLTLWKRRRSRSSRRRRKKKRRRRNSSSRHRREAFFSTPARSQQESSQSCFGISSSPDRTEERAPVSVPVQGRQGAHSGHRLGLNQLQKEDFKKAQGDNLTKVVCEPKVSDPEAGTQDCSLILAQSEVNPSCLILVLDSKGDISHMLQVMNKHKSNLEKLGIQDFQEQDIRSHQSYSRKTLIALVTSGLLLAALGTAGYFLMNRRSWSPAGERLGEDPYYTENGGGQGYGAGSGASLDSQEKATQNRGAQENGTSQATSSNGHSSRQHVVADTEL
uniref:CD34 molecule n=1 Tax=Sarcophilus harrisii TaxID=9305 RepID=A0A7N4V064_SARHA